MNKGPDQKGLKALGLRKRHSDSIFYMRGGTLLCKAREAIHVCLLNLRFEQQKINPEFIINILQKRFRITNFNLRSDFFNCLQAFSLV